MGTGTDWSKGTGGQYQTIEDAYNQAAADSDMLNNLSMLLDGGTHHIVAVASALLPPTDPLQAQIPVIVKNWYGSDEVSMWPVNAVLSGKEVAVLLNQMGRDAVAARQAGKMVEFWCKCGHPEFQIAVEDGEKTVKFWIATPYNSGYGLEGVTEEDFAKAVDQAEAKVDSGATGKELNDALGNVAWSSPTMRPVFEGKLRRSRGEGDPGPVARVAFIGAFPAEPAGGAPYGDQQSDAPEGPGGPVEVYSVKEVSTSS